jgi:hypothetical protein
MIDAAGNSITSEQVQAMCGGPAQPDSVIYECMVSNGIANRLLYHPPDRFWTFQAIEAAIFLGAAAVLLGLTVWMVSRRMR